MRGSSITSSIGNGKVSDISFPLVIARTSWVDAWVVEARVIGCALPLPSCSSSEAKSLGLPGPSAWFENRGRPCSCP